jgi:hypothetical protein
MSLQRAHSLALRAEIKTDEGHRTGSEAKLREARQLHAQAAAAFGEAGDVRQARYHQREAKKLYYEIHRHDPDPSDPYHRGSRENPLGGDTLLFGLSGLELALIAGGLGIAGYVAYLLLSSSDQNADIAAAGATSPAISVAAGEPGLTPAPVWEGSVLPSGYFWGNQSNTTVPTFGQQVQALAMTSYGLASTIFGSVYVPLSPGGNVSFLVTGQTPDDPNSTISYGQAITLPLSYVAGAATS